jgi:threonine dehydratase
MTQAVSIDDVRSAAARIAGSVVRTPFLHSATLSALLGCEIWLKFENLQFTASFKERGALNKLLQLTPDERARGVIAMSAGNHAQGVAYHAGRLGIAATIVMPTSTPNVKVRNTRAHGAEVILAGDSLDEASTRAHQFCDTHGSVFIHPYDDPFIIAGQGTVALEMLEDVPTLEVLVIPVGGGGLIAGCATAAKALNSEIRVVGVESINVPGMTQGLRGEPMGAPAETIAEGLAVRDVGEIPLAIVRELVDEMYVVGEATIEQAVALLIDIEKTVTEGAGAAGIAAVIENPDAFAGRRVGVVLCGGNIDTRVLATLMMRNLVRERRLIRIRVRVADAPGSLARLTATVAELGCNVVDVQHQRLFGVFSAKRTEVELILETRDADHADEVLARIQSEGYEVIVLDDV